MYIFKPTAHLATLKSTLISNWRMMKFNHNTRRRLPSRRRISPFRHMLIPSVRRTVITVHHTCKVVPGSPTNPPHHSRQFPEAWPTLRLRYPGVPTIYSYTAVTVMAALEALVALSVLIATIHTRGPIVTILVLDRSSGGSLNDPLHFSHLYISSRIRVDSTFFYLVPWYYTILRMRVSCRNYIESSLLRWAV